MEEPEKPSATAHKASGVDMFGQARARVGALDKANANSEEKSGRQQTDCDQPAIQHGLDRMIDVVGRTRVHDAGNAGLQDKCEQDGRNAVDQS